MGVRNGGGGTIIIIVAVIDVFTIIIVGSIRNRGCAATSARLISCESWIFNRSGYLAVVELLLVVDFGCRGRICHLQSCVDEYEVVWCSVEW